MPYSFYRFTTAFFIIALGCGTVGQAQDRSLHIALGLGLIENLQDAVGQPRYAFYPELQISATLLELERARTSLGAGLYWGFWNDGVDGLSACADCITHSYESHILGARILASLEALPLPVMIVGGLSRHLLRADYVGGAGIAGNEGADFTDGFTAAEIGLRLETPFRGRLGLTGNVQRYIPLVDEDSPWSTRTAFGIGLTYAL